MAKPIGALKTQVDAVRKAFAAVQQAQQTAGDSATNGVVGKATTAVVVSAPNSELLMPASWVAVNEASCVSARPLMAVAIKAPSWVELNAANWVSVNSPTSVEVKPLT